MFYVCLAWPDTWPAGTVRSENFLVFFSFWVMGKIEKMAKV
jgi:hypothetical protein